MEYKNPAPTTNIIVEHENKILLLKRNTEPYLGKFALPGGFVDYDEQVEVAAVREVKEETGVDIEVIDQVKNKVFLNQKLKTQWDYKSTSDISDTETARLKALDDAYNELGTRLVSLIIDQF